MAEKTTTIARLFKVRTELKELLTGEMVLLTRFKLTDLLSTVEKKLENVDKLRDELIKKYGAEDKTQGFTLSPMRKNENGEDVPNEKFKEFLEEFEPILNQEELVTYKELKLDVLGKLNTTGNIEAIFDFISEED
jgi:hypothetical protein